MSQGKDAIDALRNALALSPNNIPLRQHLAHSLMTARRFGEAEEELRAALALAPDNHDIKVSLASSYYEQEKNSEALVIIEDMVNQHTATPEAYVLYARLCLRTGDIPMAVAQYKLAIEADPDIADPALAERLGVAATDEEGDVFEGRLRAHREDVGEAADIEIERPVKTFDDVGGMETIKEEIGVKIIYPMQHPEVYQAYGKQAGGGILMYGPPGCGKTYLARATAGEIHAGFLSVGISDVLEMWIGNSERNLHELFHQARLHQPCVLFVDEVDALGGRRTDMQGSGRQLINQFLSEMDGVEHSNEGVLVLAATNAPWHVDPAFRRPGRFDRVVFVPPPDRAGRIAILKIHLQDKPTDTIDIEMLAAKTETFSGADLSAVVEGAVEIKLREAMKTGTPVPLTTKDLLASLKRHKSTTREWFATARNHALYSNQGGAYDDVLEYLKKMKL